MLKLYDWECQACGGTHEGFIDAPKGGVARRSVRQRCPLCGMTAQQHRLMSAPSRYVGEDYVSPRFGGGVAGHDTLGMVVPPHYPELPDGCTMDAFREISSKPEYREIERQRKVIGEQNRAKQKRNQAMKKGWHINLRRKENQLPGDPKDL